MIGNPEVVAMLERWLEEARRGQINYAGLFVIQKPDQVACDFTGAVEMEQCTPAGIEGLKAKIGQSIRDRQPPPRDLTLGANYVCYRPYQQPSNFDFISWLVQREMERIREGAPAPLKVAFWSPPGLDYKRKMLDPVVRAMVPLLGAVEDAAAKHGRLAPLDAGFANIVAGARAGEAVPKLSAPGAARSAVRDFLGYHPPVVTITLRETEHDLSRNSNTSAWLAAARRIQADGYRVIFVRDTAKATESIAGFETMSTASLMLDIRLALYEFAKLNFFVANGPLSLALFSDVPWRAFIAASDDDPVPVSTPAWWKDHHGIGPGEQFPWSGPDQGIIWAPDEYENIIAAWEAWQSAVRCAPALTG